MADPTPVTIEAPVPIPVDVVAGASPAAPSMQPGQAGTVAPNKPDVMTLPTGKIVAAPTTTEEEDRATVGQRRINLIWEVTQGIIAIMVTSSTLYVAGRLALKESGETASFLLLSNAFFVVVTTYIVRTNHQKIGGVGKGDTGR